MPCYGDRLGEEYTNRSLLEGPIDQPLKGMYGLVLPNDKIVPLDDPNDQVEIARKIATLGGEFDYYDKDFVDFNATELAAHNG